MSRILLDLNNPFFQQDLFVLPKAEALAVLKILKKVSQLTWEQLYKDQGLKWELINITMSPDVDSDGHDPSLAYF
jgi:hypothetical protein